MNRSYIISTYTVVEDRIVSSWKYTGQRLYVPFLWDRAEEGWADAEADNGDPLFVTLPEDLKEFPELSGRKMIRLHEDDEGRVTEVDPDTGTALPIPAPKEPTQYELGLLDARKGTPVSAISSDYLRGYADGLDHG
jgi:hypothetical protein